MAAHQDKAGRLPEAHLRPGERPDQPIEPLDRGEPPRVHDDTAVRESLDVGLAIAGAAGRLAREPSPRLVHQGAPPEGAPVDRARLEQLDVQTVRQPDQALARHPQHRSGALHTRRRDHEARAAVRPGAQPRRPALGVPPAGRRAVGDPLEHQQLGAMQLSDHRHLRRCARGGLVERSEMVQVQHIDTIGAGAGELAAPGAHLTLVVEVVDACEDLVGRAAPLLEGGMQRRGAGRTLELQRRPARERGSKSTACTSP